MVNSVKKLSLTEQWNGKCECVFLTEEKRQNKEQGKSNYFFESADKVHFFLEPAAVDPETGNILSNVDKLSSVNKVGHALHVLDPVFKKYSFSQKVKDIVTSLGYKNPVLPQSMYIMKNAKVGGEVTSHQDSSFLFTTPKLTCLGLWLALDDATLENGCLWARLGSHKGPLYNRWRRTSEESSQMNFENYVSEANTSKLSALRGKTLENMSHEDLKKMGYTPLPCKAGDLVRKICFLFYKF